MAPGRPASRAPAPRSGRSPTRPDPLAAGGDGAEQLERLVVVEDLLKDRPGREHSNYLRSVSDCYESRARPGEMSSHIVDDLGANGGTKLPGRGRARAPGLRPARAPHPRKAVKTARFLALVTERHRSLDSIPLHRVAGINADLAPEVDLNAGTARTAANPADVPDRRPAVAGHLRWPAQRIRAGSGRDDDGVVEPSAEVYAGRTPKGSGRSEEDIMHPTFVKLFLEADAGELLAEEEEDKRRRANRARRTRSRMAARVAACDRERGPRR